MSSDAFSIGPVRVLVADEDPAYHLLLAESLSLFGTEYIIEHTATIDAVLASLDTSAHDLYLIPRAFNGHADGGLELIGRATREGYQPPFLLLTEEDPRALPSWAAEAGAVEVLGRRQLDPHLVDRTIRYALDRRRTTLVLQTRSAVIHATIMEAPLTIYAFDADGMLVAADGRALEDLGRRPGEPPSVSLFELYADNAIVTDTLRRTLQGASATVVMPVGRRVLECRCAPSRDADGKVNGGVVVATDVTAWYRSERALRASEEHFRRLIDNAMDIISVLTPEGIILFESPSVERILGFTPDELVGTSAFDRIHPDDQERVKLTFATELAREGACATIELRMCHRDGSWRDIEMIGTNLVADPVVGGIVVNSRDVTDRKRIERERIATLEALQASEEKYRFVAESASNAILAVDESGTILYANHASEETFGHSVDLLIGAPLAMLIPEQLRDRHEHQLRRQVRGERPSWHPLEVTAKHGSGRTIPIEISFTSSIRDGRATMTCIARDISARKRLEGERAELLHLVEEERRRLERLIAKIPCIVWESGPGSTESTGVRVGRLSFANEYLTTRLGFQPDEWLARDDFWIDVIHPEDRPRVLERVLSSRQAEVDDTFRIIARDGRVLWVDARIMILRDGERKAIGTVGIAVDVTEQIRAREALRESQRLFESFMRNSPGLSFIKDGDGRYIYANEPLLESVGRPLDQVLGRTDRDLLPPEIAEVCAESEERVRATGAPVTTEEQAGNQSWLTVKFPIVRDSGEVLIGGIGIDVTERRVVERALHREEERFRLVSLATQDAIWDWDVVTNGLWLSPNIFTLFGYPPEDIADGFTWWFSKIHPDDRERLKAGFDEVIANRTAVWTDEYRFLRGDGDYATVLDRALAVFGDDGSMVRMIGAMADITDRKRAEQLLLASEEKYREIVETTREGVWMFNSEMITTFVNARLTEMLGYTAEEMIGRKHTEFMDETAAKSASMMTERRRRGIAEQYDLRLRRKDGSEVWAIVSANPILDEERNFVGSLKMITDITDRKRAEEELQEAHDQLEVRVAERTAELTETMGRLELAHRLQKQFVADASHHLRTPLTVIHAELELLLRRASLSEDVADTLRRVDGETARLRSLSNDLLLLARLDFDSLPERPRPLRLDDILLESIEKLSALTAGKDMRWDIEIEDPVEIWGDRTALEHAIMNILENAIKFSPPGESIRVGLHERGGRGEITVGNQGPTIAERDLPHLFDRFFRAESTLATPGTGLGLAIVKAVVDRHGGAVTASSTGDRGTIFTISLPVDRIGTIG